MWFSAKIKVSGPSINPLSPPTGTTTPLAAPPRHCLVNATSSSAAGTSFELVDYYCDNNFPSSIENWPGDDATGLFDPSIFLDPTTQEVVLSWSRQRGELGDGNSAIVSMTLESDGSMPTVRSPATVLTFDQLKQDLPGLSLGNRAVIENPQFVYTGNSTNPYAFFASYGSYKQAGFYHSIKALTSATLDVRPTSPIVISDALKAGDSDPNPRQIGNPGSVSTLKDTEPSNVFVFSAPKDGDAEPRRAYWRPYFWYIQRIAHGLFTLATFGE